MTAATGIEAVYRAESRRVLATLIRLLGGFDRAEEAMHDAFAAAAEQWPRDGVPKNPFAWLVSAGRFKAIDRIRRNARHDASLAEIAMRMEQEQAEPPDMDQQAVADDQLRLIFTCCHPALPADAQTALTLREVCGLATEEIAAAFLSTAPTIAQRIVRAKARIRDEKIPYETPEKDQLAERLEHVLRVIYLVFNEGYSASSGASLTRADLSAEAIRLGRLLVELLPDPEALGLLALMLLHDSRQAARAAADGSLILFDDQDRRLWDRGQIAEGRELVRRAFASGEVGAYAIQAAIAAEHTAATVDWTRIVSLYDMLLQAGASPVVELNRAVAIAMRDGPDVGLELIDALLLGGKLVDYHVAHGARGELLRRAGRTVESREAFGTALRLVRQDPIRDWIERRLASLD
ncbi:MAG: RNA polymerase sigma factor [Rhizobiaceae bacterium]|nr:RNA polymerase sigma factor [Rhizobiaceae bacterium]